MRMSNSLTDLKDQSQDTHSQTSQTPETASPQNENGKEMRRDNPSSQSQPQLQIRVIATYKDLKPPLPPEIHYQIAEALRRCSEKWILVYLHEKPPSRVMLRASAAINSSGVFSLR